MKRSNRVCCGRAKLLKAHQKFVKTPPQSGFNAFADCFSSSIDNPAIQKWLERRPIAQPGTRKWTRRLNMVFIGNRISGFAPALFERNSELIIRRNYRTRAGRPSFDQVDSETADLFRSVGERTVLSRAKKVPLWRQLSARIEELIYNGRIGPDSRIPSEPALCEIFGVSRPVVQSAIGALVAKGLVVRLPRKGMFVANRIVETDFETTNLSLFEDMIARGARVTADTFELTKCAPSEKEQLNLKLGAGQEVVRIGRVFWINEQPLTYTHISYPAAKVDGLEEMIIEGKPILGLIRTKFGRRPHRAERWFRAAMPKDEVADKMGVPADRPMIWIESVAFEADGTPLEFYRAFYNSATAPIHMSISD